MFLDCFRILLLQFYVVALLIQSKSLVDARDVTSSDTCTEWKTDVWTNCSGKKNDCGFVGQQFRSVRCYDILLKINTYPQRCDPNTKPTDNKKCFIICEEHKNQFKWLLEEWQTCMPTANIPPHLCSGGIPGFQHRNVSCVNIRNSSFVVGNEVCAELFGNADAKRSCRNPCPSNCVTSMFGSWSRCATSWGNASQIRLRHVIRLPRNEGASCPPLTETRICHAMPFNSSQTTLMFESWSSCQQSKVLPRKSRPNVLQYLVGIRKRKITCKSSSGKEVGRQSIAETCIRTVHCAVTAWSKWGFCSSSCGKKGTQNRTRSVERLPQGAGASPCPSLIEHKSCNVSLDGIGLCLRHKWFAGDWSICTSVHGTSCGGGLQTRQIYCIRHSSTDFALMNISDILKVLRPVDADYCHSIEKPQEWRECDIPCEQKCDVSAWSDWSDCALSSCPGDPDFVSGKKGFNNLRNSKSPKGFKRRVRSIYNAYGFPTDCPHLIEILPCNHARCFSWRPESMTSCRPHRGDCGAGVATTRLSCHDMWGKKVNQTMCDMYPQAYDVPRKLNCSVPCSGDCVLSEWSPWSPCPVTCNQKNAPRKKNSGIQTRRRMILAHAGLGQTPCPNDSQLVDTKPCNRHKCSSFFWNTKRWSECRASRSNNVLLSGRLDGSWMFNETFNAYEQSQLTCGMGYQTRDVSCKKRRVGRVEDKSCMARSKPVSRRSCKLSCDRDCVLSAWSSWSSCEKECQKWMGKDGLLPSDHGSVKQRRNRFVIRHRSGGGDSCSGNMTETRTCDRELACAVYRWRTGSWSSCLLAVGVRSIEKGGNSCVGVRTRSVLCVVDTATGSGNALLEHCIKTSSPPPAAKLCRKKCGKDLKLGEWQERYGCSLPKPSIAKDQVEFGTTPSPFYPTTQVEAVGPWSSCFVDVNDLTDNYEECEVTNEVIDDESSFAPGRESCEIGKRKRALKCVDRNSSTSYGVSSCNYTTFEWEECKVSCSRDCEMSGWTQWGECGDLHPYDSTKLAVPFCGENIRTRYQFQLEESLNLGRRCPALDNLTQIYQREPCRSECWFYFWSDERNSRSCNLSDENIICGRGTQVRTVTCYRNVGYLGFSNTARVVKNETVCDMSQSPYGANECELPCLSDCVLSLWSSWEPCLSVDEQMSCERATRRRTRRVLRQPATGLDCSKNTSLEEREDCVLNRNCYTYNAEFLEWSTCILPEDAECGSGFQKRRARCIRSDGISMQMSKCQHYNISLPAPEERPCRVPCSIDCRVSGWSIWSSCIGDCGRSRIRTRTRTILMEASYLGRPCPTELEQTKPCCWLPCYKWKLMGWGACDLPEGSCGEGSQRRVVACVQPDGVEVKPSLCQQSGAEEADDQFASSLLVRTCHVRCSGTCQWTKWSPWSSCHGDCNDNAAVGAGRKTRSRSSYIAGEERFDLCPPSEIEEVDCPFSEAVCYTYSWKTSNRLGIWEIWCERAPDGVKVSFGCFEASKPKMDMPTCNQNCRLIEGAVCSEEGKCLCVSPNKAIFRDDNHLLSCNKDDQPKHSGAKDNVTSVVSRAILTTSSINIFAPDVKNNRTDWSLFYPFNEDGSLKPWTYAAIVGLVVLLIFIIAVTYLLYSACRRSGSSPRKRRHRHSNGSNVGMVVTSTGGCSVYGTGGNGPPPYLVNSSKQTNNSKYIRGRDFTRTPSNRSMTSYRDRYDDDF